jgi:hypothetical protein
MSAILITAACGERHGIATQRISARVVSKSDNTPFFARFATETSRVVVQDRDSIGGLNLNIPAGHRLFFFELNDKNTLALTNEVFREDRVVLFSARDDREAYIIANKAYEFAHPQEVQTSELKFPVARGIEQNSPRQKANFISAANINVDGRQMREDLESLSGARPITVNGQTVTLTNRQSADNKAKARAWLRANYEAMGFTVSEQTYNTGINLVAEKRASSQANDKIFVVSGHLDTVATAGADDDGSGVISSLTVARAIKDLSLKNTIRFVAFDEEERGLIGSKAYAKELARTGEISKVTVFNIEMTGYDSDSDGAFHSIDCDENTSGTLTQSVMAAISGENIALAKTDACTNRSDHAVFWEYDRPAIVISQNFFGGDDNPCYHRSCDTVQKVNWDYMTKMTQAAASAVAAMNQ